MLARFGRLFPNMVAAQFGSTEEENRANLNRLAMAMKADPDPPKDGPDEEESGIPALYTYFGQFVDHDITFDPASSLQKQNDPDALVDYRTPALDLDNIYGRGPDDQPYLYGRGPVDPPDANAGKKFLLGKPLQGGDAGARDLPRNSADPARALIGDPRNDENAIVSQLQGLFLRFHNRTVDDNPGMKFEEVQQRVRFHYQYVVLHDFLRRIVHSSVLDDLKTGGHYDRGKLRFFHWTNQPFMPVEFSVAAYRLGHSMVRPGYRLNDNDSTLLPIFRSSGNDLRGFQAMDAGRGIDWARFIDIDIRAYDGSPADDKRRLQFAYRIDTSLVNPLSDLPLVVVSTPPFALAERNLRRGWSLGLPSAQNVARAMGIKPLSDEKIWIGKAVKPQGKPRTSIVDVSKVFADNCPLWTYILAEAMHYQEKTPIPVQGTMSIDTPKLGPVGGRIVAEVLLGLLFADQSSLLNNPNCLPETGSDYALKDFVGYALHR
ncbi:MAG TPA: heme peroxidase family protein [Candidatus Binatia bacterium]|nr:heme peroxidase family protein [Candidatus Binatia bacterium]